MITIHIPGAKPEEIVRGLLAAQEVFDKAGVTPHQAAEAQFDMEGWDIRGFEEEAPDNSDICNVWREADLAAVAACCEEWSNDQVPDTAELELVTEPMEFRLSAGDPDSETMFENALPGILDQLCEEGYFDDERPEDDVVEILDFQDIDALTEGQRKLYVERLLPLMRIWAFERDRFEEEYNRRRAEWAAYLPTDARQTEFFEQ